MSWWADDEEDEDGERVGGRDTHTHEQDEVTNGNPSQIKV